MLSLEELSEKRPRQRSTARQEPRRQHGARAPCSQFTKNLGWSRYRGISNAVASRSTRIEIDHQIVNPDLQKITSRREQAERARPLGNDAIALSHPLVAMTAWSTI